MGIIGVVAALTLPNLNSSTGDKEKVAKVKKIYQNLNDAFGRAEAVYGPYDEWCKSGSRGVNCADASFERIVEFMKVSKLCETASKCSFTFGQNGSAGYSNPLRGAILADGTTFSYRGDGLIRIDIDGVEKGANKPGNDFFEFLVSNEDGVHINKNMVNNSTAYVANGSGSNCTYARKCFNAYNAATWIITFGNMDYLKTTDGTTCPDGKTKLTVGGNHSCK